MNRFSVAPVARDDLDEIWYYIARDNPLAADKLIAHLFSYFIKLASMPEMGQRRDERIPKLRSFSTGNYVIFYRRVEDEIQIARVLHGARDFPPLFE